MAYDSILVRYGEMFLKSGNLYYFENKLVQNIKVLTGLSTIIKLRGRFILPYFPNHCFLQRVFGISSYSLAYTAEKSLEAIQEKSLALLPGKCGAFKVETRRSDKRFPLPSLQISAEVGKFIEAKTKWQFDFAHPRVMIYIEINNKRAYLYTETIAGLGGLPVGTAGKVHLLLEDEADLLAGLLMMKRGGEIIPLLMGKEKDISLLQKFSPKKIEAVDIGHTSDLSKYLLKNNISVLVSGDNFEGRERYDFPAVIFRPLVAYSVERIGEGLERYRNV